jgi:hypothetical protein
LSVRLCIAAAVVLLVWATPAGAEVQRPEERAYIVVHGGRGYDLVVGLYPKRNVALLYAEKGEPEVKGARWSGAAYAIHPAPKAFEGGVKVSFGKLAKIRGRFVAEGPARISHRNRFCEGRNPVAESGHFQGRIVFKGEDGYSTVRAHRAFEYVSRSFRLRCKHGHAAKFQNRVPGLFGYLGSPAGTFSNRDGTFLSARVRDDQNHRVTEFFAFHHLFEQSSTFKAATLEWLPGEIAAMRWAEVWRVAVETFTLTPPERNPATAIVRPPAPFEGEAAYSRASHRLEGDLSVSFPGLKLPLASPTSDAGTCALTRRMVERVCDFSRASVQPR